MQSVALAVNTHSTAYHAGRVVGVALLVAFLAWVVWRVLRRDLARASDAPLAVRVSRDSGGHWEDLRTTRSGLLDTVGGLNTGTVVEARSPDGRGTIRVAAHHGSTTVHWVAEDGTSYGYVPPAGSGNGQGAGEAAAVVRTWLEGGRQDGSWQRLGPGPTT